MRHDFDDAIGVVPPSPIDVDRLITRGRRRAVVRRLAVAGSAGAVAAVAAGATVVFAGGASGGSGGASVAAPSVIASPSPSPSSTFPSPVPSPRGSVPASRARHVEQYLRQQLPAVIHAHAPGVSIPGGAFDAKYMWQGTNANDSYFATGNLQRSSARGNVAINVGTRGPHWDPMNPCDQAETGPCSVDTEADGTTVLRREINENGIRDYYVVVDRPDGQTIFLVAANQGGQLDSGAGHQPNPVLTMDELVAIGHDAHLTAEPA